MGGTCEPLPRGEQLLKATRRAHIHPRCERADKDILQPHPQCMSGASPRPGTGRSTLAQWREQSNFHRQRLWRLRRAWWAHQHSGRQNAVDDEQDCAAAEK